MAKEIPMGGKMTSDEVTRIEKRSTLVPPPVPYDAAALARDVYVTGLEAGHVHTDAVIAAGRCLVAYFERPSCR